MLNDLNKFTWASFEYNWARLLRECGYRREKETNIVHSKNIYENAYCPTNKTSDTT